MGFGQWMGVLDGVVIVEGGAVSGKNVEHPIVTNGILCMRGGDAALPKLHWDFLFNLLWICCRLLVRVVQSVVQQIVQEVVQQQIEPMEFQPVKLPDLYRDFSTTNKCNRP